jgi:CheY-like chemotaxis protein
MARILCLDDEGEMLDLMRLILEPAGYELLTTTDSYEALELLRRERVDLLTQDFMRPDVDGWELMRRMKADAHLARIPVLGVTAGAREARARQAARVGLDLERDLVGFVNKPFGPHELLEAVGEALDRRRRRWRTKRNRCGRSRRGGWAGRICRRRARCWRGRRQTPAPRCARRRRGRWRSWIGARPDGFRRVAHRRQRRKKPVRSGRDEEAGR